MNQEDYVHSLFMPTPERIKNWWEDAAHDAYEKGRYTLITERGSDEVYMARFWLTKPELTQMGHLKSSDSVLLHNILKPDDCEAMHDHPWDFKTNILSGGYREMVPTSWSYSLTFGGPQLGPDETMSRAKIVGDEVKRYADDLHSIQSVQPNTWTLVTTKSKSRTWGFHPAGKPWVSYEEFLK